MRPYPLIVLILIAAFSSYSQRDWKINAQPAAVSKSANPGFFEIAENLKWGQVVSDCIGPNEVKVGTWLSYRPKKPEVTLTFRTGGKWGDDIEGAVIYLGQIVDHKGEKVLKEVGCIRASDDQKESVLSFNDLTPKAQYYILVSGKNVKPGDHYNLHLSDKFTESFEQKSEVETEDEKKDHSMVLGRVMDESNTPKSDVLVSLLNQRMQPIETSSTQADGTFKFERLPQDEPVLARIDEDDGSLALEMILVGADGQIESRARKIGVKLYTFESIENGFSDLVLLSDKDWTLNVNKGSVGVAGRLVDVESYLFGIPNVEIGLYNSNSDEIKTTKTDNQGSFQFKNVARGKYQIKVKGDDHRTFSEVVMVDDLNVPYEYSNSNMKDDGGVFVFKSLPADIVKMKRMEIEDAQLSMNADFANMDGGEAIVLERILFESGSAQLVSSSYEELNELVNALKKNANISIEISGHTDDQGSATSNKSLSLGRAEAVKQYLVNKGVDSSRLKAVGYGEEKPIGSNETEEGRRQNRRVSIQKRP